MTTTVQPISLEHKWRTLLILALAELLGMAVWFSASAVVPALTEAWELTDNGRSWRYAFIILAVGPAVGILAMWLLRKSERAELMANGNR